MPNGTYGGVRGRKTKVGRKLLRFPPTRLPLFCLAVRIAKRPGYGGCKIRDYRAASAG